jgi:hypothetical protein
MMAKRGELELSPTIMLILGYAAIIAGDLWALPWRYLLEGGL